MDSWFYPPHTKVAASPARPGPRGAKQGGVAMVCPFPQRLLEHRTIVPGCAVRRSWRRPRESGR
eukprot:830052-Lingulodinium_polyedra.AAC.1